MLSVMCVCFAPNKSCVSRSSLLYVAALKQNLQLLLEVFIFFSPSAMKEESCIKYVHISPFGVLNLHNLGTKSVFCVNPFELSLPSPLHVQPTWDTMPAKSSILRETELTLVCKGKVVLGLFVMSEYDRP